MELSPEHKQRILDEEQQRLAEEQYRQQIREQLSEAPQTPRASSKRWIGVLVGILAIAALSAALLLLRSSTSPRAEASSSTPAVAGPHGNAETPISAPVEKLTTAQIATKAIPAVVIVENFNENGEKAGQGSGYVYSTDGIIVTNYHVIRGASSLVIRVPGKEGTRTDRLLGYSPESDVAVIRVSESQSAALETDGVGPVKVGDRVVAIGAPFGLENTVSEGIVSALREVGGIRILQTTASISPGSSGGPLLNEFGKVIGLTTAEIRNGQNLNFVVSANQIHNLVNERRPITLGEMLAETLVTNPISMTTVPVPARAAVPVQIVVPGEQGAVLEGTYQVHGGLGDDIGVSLLADDNRVLMNSGIVKVGGRIKQRLQRGRYTLLFDNRLSTFTAKSISPELRLSYYK